MKNLEKSPLLQVRRRRLARYVDALRDSFIIQ